MGGSASPGKPKKSGRRGKDKCDLWFKTSLFSPVASVVESLSVGDQLDVILYTQNQTMSIVAQTQSTAEIAGTITGAQELGDLIACLQDGVIYVADVIGISGAVVDLTVKRV